MAVLCQIKDLRTDTVDIFRCGVVAGARIPKSRFLGEIMNDIDRAEYVQAIRAFLIPSSLFVACLLGAAGTFCLVNGEQLGWALIVGMVATIAWAFHAFINFQNKVRQRGGFRGKKIDVPAPENR